MAKFRADSSASKVDLGVGVYRDLSGNTPVLASVRSAEQAVLSGQTTKSYVAAAGREEFNRAVEEMVLGSAHRTRSDRRARTVQTPEGAVHCALARNSFVRRSRLPRFTSAIPLGAITLRCWADRVCAWSAILTTTRLPTGCASTRCSNTSIARPQAT